MGKESRRESRRARWERENRPEWGALEELARVKVRGWIQDLLEEELTEFLGRRKSERRAAVGVAPVS